MPFYLIKIEHTEKKLCRMKQLVKAKQKKENRIQVKKWCLGSLTPDVDERVFGLIPISNEMNFSSYSLLMQSKLPLLYS